MICIIALTKQEMININKIMILRKNIKVQKYQSLHKEDFMGNSLIANIKIERKMKLKKGIVFKNSY